MRKTDVLIPPSTPSNLYYDCRYAVLREPIGFERGSEILNDDNQAIHAWIEEKGLIMAVGRAHLIPEGSDGSSADHPGPSASQCPPFGPLADSKNRPAVQIRQMGTRPESRRMGYAAEVLRTLENTSSQHFGAKVGLLQAREAAIPFYLAQGWNVVDQPYIIAGIGPHRSMIKYFQT